MVFSQNYLVPGVIQLRDGVHVGRVDVFQNPGVGGGLHLAENPVSRVFVGENADFEEFRELDEKIKHPADVRGVAVTENH